MGVFEVVLRKMPSSFLARKALCSQFLRLAVVAKSAQSAGLQVAMETEARSMFSHSTDGLGPV